MDDDDELRAALEAAFDDIQAYYGELEGESPRAAAILAATNLEDELEALLRKQFSATVVDEKDNDQERSKKRKLWKRIAGPGPTPLGSAKAKADVLQAFGFYGQETRDTIERISEIRNRFAHERSARDFSDPKIVEICRRLKNNPIQPFVFREFDPQYLREVFIEVVERTSMVMRGVHSPWFDRRKNLP
ncbi:MAG: hypothetical protein TEF_00340 [Rhizobiales bacterium NRL2]|jgi:hypothetical protein|nr:MAG: hypothetical protein TEF_00340 [Rhizobiales bacterium NRL2]